MAGRLVLELRPSSYELAAKVVEYDGFHDTETYVYEDGSIEIGPDGTSDAICVRDAIDLVDRIVDYVSEELFDGHRPTVDDEVYTWQN